MSSREVLSAEEYRKALLRIIWSGARRIGWDFDPRSLAPERLSGQPGETFSQCTLEELRGVAYQLKRLVPGIWVPSPPFGLYLRGATPHQLNAIQEHLGRQSYLVDPAAFFRERLKVRNPEAPTYAEACRMLAYLNSKQRSLLCAKPA